MSIYRRAGSVTLCHGDCLSELESIGSGTVDAVVTDPPYGLSNTSPAQVAETVNLWSQGDREYMPGGRGFMGKTWDGFVPPPAVWDECMRVLKPGGHMLVFAGSRTQDLMGLSIRLAGFEIRDSVAWLYGSGFPKSLDVSKAIDKTNGRVEGAVLELKAKLRGAFDASGLKRSEVDAQCGFRASNYLTLPAEGKRPDPWVNVLPTAEKWEKMRDILGFGSSLDGLFDAAEREVVGTRNVIPGVAFQSDGPAVLDVTAPATPEAERWQGWGTALKPAHEPIIMARKPLEGTVAGNVLEHGAGALNIDATRVSTDAGDDVLRQRAGSVVGDTAAPFGRGASMAGVATTAGRWPANVVVDEYAADVIDGQSGASKSPNPYSGERYKDSSMFGVGGVNHAAEYGDSGGASRFFYTAKAPKRERPNVAGTQHPTVKPLALMRWLVRMVTPPGGTVLDPFAGSGTTIEAALLEGMKPIGIEREAEYLPLIHDRIARAQSVEPDLFTEETA